MPEHYKVLIVILVLAVFAKGVSRRAFAPGLMDGADLARRWRVWFLLTLIAFLSPNPWLYLGASMLLLHFAGKREGNRFALFLFVLFVLPPFSIELPGFGLVNRLFDVNHMVVLALMLLLPEMLAARRRPDHLRFGSLRADWLLAAYLVLMFVLDLRGTTFTDAMRRVFVNGLEVFLPYYVASRSLRDLPALKDAMAAFVTACLAMSVMAMFEYVKTWALYITVPGHMGAMREMGGYLMRAGSLRAVATAGQSIALGYMLMVAFGFQLGLMQYIERRAVQRLVFLLLLGGLFAALARGPWVGALLLLGGFLALGERPFASLAKLAGVLTLGFLVALLLPGGERLLDLLPFVGSVDAANVEYRQRLLDNAWIVFQRHPWLGAVNYRDTPEMLSMIQGQGIIDIVNSYLGVVLEYGLFGLVLFCGFFLSVVAGLWRLRTLRHALSPELQRFGSVLTATLVAVLVTIFTVSSIAMIPVVYWSLAGMCVAYTQLASMQPAGRPVPARRRTGPRPVRRGPFLPAGPVYSQAQSNRSGSSHARN